MNNNKKLKFKLKFKLKNNNKKINKKIPLSKINNIKNLIKKQ